MAQSPEDHAGTSEIIRYDLGWNAINAMLRSGRSLSGHERNCCFLNLGDGRFANVSAAANLDFIDDGRVVALTDWDYDGDVDFWIANRSGPQVRMVRNELEKHNGAAAGRHFVAIALQGVHCNRDAIGARVTVVTDGRQPSQQHQTLRAGEGYLAQSSKWLHFGLGAADRIDRVKVRWPNGREQTFDGIAANAWYRLGEGDHELTRWTPPASLKPLVPSEFTSPPVTDRARIVLLAPLPLPKLTVEDAAGVTISLNEPAEGMRLINLWASWCQPCLEELGEWRDDSERFEDAGLRIVAVNVDTDDERSVAETRANALAIWNRLELPFENRFGSSAVAARFDAIQRSLLSRQRPLPVPCSFLIDPAGRLRAVYKGPVAAETLLRDIRLQHAEPAEILTAALPFSGRWHAPPGGSTPLQIALMLIGGGYNDDAEDYIRSVLQSDQRAQYESASLLNLLGALSLDKRQYEEAAGAFSRTLTLDPHNRQAQRELGGLLLRQRKGAEAAPHFEALLKADPDDPEMLYSLGLAYLQQRRINAAEVQFRSALALRPHPLAHWQLANISVASRDAAQAISHYEAALKLDPGLAHRANNLAWLLATVDNDNLRNGPRAVGIAEQIGGHHNHANASHLDTLAAAYAEAGRFAEAVETADRALQRALAEQNDSLAERIRERLELYQKRTPFRERFEP